jgi:hypothetical protein
LHLEIAPLPIAGLRSQPLGRDELVASADEFGNFFPIDFAGVQAESDPSFRSYVGGQIKPAGLSVGESFVVSGQDLAIDGDDAVSMMVVEEIGKRLFSNPEAGVLTVVPARSLGKRKADFGESDQATVFGLLPTARSALRVKGVYRKRARCEHTIMFGEFSRVDHIVPAPSP